MIWRTAGSVDGVQNLYALPHVVPPSVLEYLAERNDVVVPTMLATLSRLPLANPPSTMAALVRRAGVLSIARELRRMAATQGTPLQGDHLGRLLVDIMHDLAHGAASWVPNSEKARLWHAQDGTYVVWPGAFQDICTYADHERLHGLPSDAHDAVPALERAGMIVRAQEGPLWSLRPPGANGDLTGLKLAFPELVLGAQLATCAPLPPLCSQPAPTEATQSEMAPTTPPTKPGETPNKPQADVPPEQLQLPLAQRHPSKSHADAATPAEPDALPPGAPALVNSMRLPPVIADVLRRAISGLTGDGSSEAVQVIREGILIPMQVFRSANLDAKMATRSLRDAGMLVVGEAGNPTYTAKSNGIEVRGLVLKRQFVTGLPPMDRDR
jgi:conjugal transfer pilus assembly protein TraI